MYFLLFVEVLCLSLFCYALLCVHISFAIILKRKRKLVALLLLYYRCIVLINVMWLFLTVPRVGLQYVIVVFPDHTNFLLECKAEKRNSPCEQGQPMAQTKSCFARATRVWVACKSQHQCHFWRMNSMFEAYCTGK